MNNCYKQIFPFQNRPWYCFLGQINCVLYLLMENFSFTEENTALHPQFNSKNIKDYCLYINFKDRKYTVYKEVCVETYERCTLLEVLELIRDI